MEKRRRSKKTLLTEIAFIKVISFYKFTKEVNMKSNKIVKSLSILAIVSISTATFATPSCNKNTVSGNYRFEEQSRVGDIVIKSDGTYSVTELSIVDNIVTYTPAEKGTFIFLKGCAALLTPENHRNSYPIFFSNTSVVGDKRVPNSGVWKGGSMFRRISR